MTNFFLLSFFFIMKDPNHGSVMYESENILKHVFNNYGPGEKHIPYLLGPAKLATRNSQLGTPLLLSSTPSIPS